MNAILIIAHAPLASALRSAVLHVYPECTADISAYDVQASRSSEASLHAALSLVQTDKPCLIFSDVFGATPSNVAQALATHLRQAQPQHAVQHISGANLPMLLRCASYRHLALDVLVQKALDGGHRGIHLDAA